MEVSNRREVSPVAAVYLFCELTAPPVRRALGTFGLHLILEEALAGLELNGVDAPLELFRDRSILLEARRVGLLAELPEQHGVALLLAGGAFPTSSSERDHEWFHRRREYALPGSESHFGPHAVIRLHGSAGGWAVTRLRPCRLLS
jgi:hypothetical protein